MSANNEKVAMTPREVRAALRIGNTKFWADIKSGALPPPDFSLGPKSPRWLWTSVIAHLTQRNVTDSRTTHTESAMSGVPEV